MYPIAMSSRASPGWSTSVPPASAVHPSPPVNMKSLVTMRTVSVGPTGVNVPDGPSGALQIPSITGVVPLQWNWTLRPATCGNRPVAIDESHTGEKPFRKPSSSCAPVYAGGAR